MGGNSTLRSRFIEFITVKFVMNIHAFKVSW